MEAMLDGVATWFAGGLGPGLLAVVVAAVAFWAALGVPHWVHGNAMQTDGLVEGASMLEAPVLLLTVAAAAVLPERFAEVAYRYVLLPTLVVYVCIIAGAVSSKYFNRGREEEDDFRDQAERWPVLLAGLLLNFGASPFAPTGVAERLQLWSWAMAVACVATPIALLPRLWPCLGLTVFGLALTAVPWPSWIPTGQATGLLLVLALSGAPRTLRPIAAAVARRWRAWRYARKTRHWKTTHELCDQYAAEGDWDRYYATLQDQEFPYEHENTIFGTDRDISRFQRDDDEKLFEAVIARVGVADRLLEVARHHRSTAFRFRVFARSGKCPDCGGELRKGTSERTHDYRNYEGTSGQVSFTDTFLECSACSWKVSWLS